MIETNLDELVPDDPFFSDYDGAWKEAIRFHLQEFIERCFPVVSLLIDWSVQPEWLDKEISQIIGHGGRRNREVDLLFKVRLVNGRDQWVLCHLEIQTSYESDFTVRIDLYNAGLKWTFQKEVLTLVILADLKPNWRPSEHHFALGGFGYDLRFPICKLLDRLSTDWADVTHPIEALRTANDPNARFYAKTQIVRNLYRAGYTADDLRSRFRLIDWMMQLPKRLNRQFNDELSTYEKELEMPYVTSIERMAKEDGLKEGLEKGLEQGREEGGYLLLLRLLNHACGIMPFEIEQRIRQFTSQQIQLLADTLFEIKSLADLENFLKTKIS